tara:strand:+ start:217399 stop:217581 length:183 start_codon:yes stop_codon:yes gene_type:complete
MLSNLAIRYIKIEANKKRVAMRITAILPYFIQHLETQEKKIKRNDPFWGELIIHGPLLLL